MSANPLVLVKIGGSLITDKKKPFTVKKRELELICQEIKKAVEQTDKQIVIGHGSGSFAHVPAKRYKTIDGFVSEESAYGMTVVQDAASQLNRIVVDQLVKTGVSAMSVSPSSFMLASNQKLAGFFIEPIYLLLKNNVLPVVYGDVICDLKLGCTIYSTEKVLAFLAQAFLKEKVTVERIIHCGSTEGVYDDKSKTISKISRSNFEKVKKYLGYSKGIDVTGGMAHKVFESVALARKGIPSLIIDGIINGVLSDAILGKKVKGTEIEW